MWQVQLRASFFHLNRMFVQGSHLVMPTTQGSVVLEVTAPVVSMEIWLCHLVMSDPEEATQLLWLIFSSSSA